MVTADLNSRWCRFRKGLVALYGSLICALVIVFLDVVLDGSYLFSIIICPIWFLVSVVRAAVRRPNQAIALVRILIPIIVVFLVVMNYSVQWKIAMTNAARIIQASEAYHKTNGTYPERLDDLVPRFLNSVPRAKYCCESNEFHYFVSPQQHTLSWYQIPPFGRRVYTFETGKWRYLD